MSAFFIAAATAYLSVPKVDLGPAPDISRVDSLLEAGGVPLHRVGYACWPAQFPDTPDVSFRIAHSGDEIYIKFYVRESAARAVHDSDGHRPWEESCVEFFVIPGTDDVYYNLEMNCLGFGILHGGAPGDRSAVPGGVEKIRRLASMPPTPFGVRDEECSWTLTLAIPVEAYSLTPVPPLSGRTLRGNLYKCGDLLPRPHYLAWSPVDTPKPSFHEPGFFGELFFE